MNVLINMDTMAVIGKHGSFRALCALAEIECAINASYVFGIENKIAYKQFTSLEMKMILQGLGYNFPEEPDRALLLKHLKNALRALSERDLIPADVVKCAELMREDVTSNWSYSKGSRVPLLQESVFCYAPLSQAEQAINHKAAPSVQHAYDKQASEGNCTASVQRPAASRTADTTAVPKGSVSVIVFDIADKYWSDAGKPTDKQTVMKLRKEIMDILEQEHEIKRTTASSTLGAWHQSRAPF